MKSAGKARNNGLYRHIRTSKEIIRNLLNDLVKNNRHMFGRKGRLFFLIVMITVFMIVVDVCDKGCQFEEKTPQFQQIAKSYNAVHHKESPPICSRGTYGS